MADKKMTALTDLSTGIASDDILHVVDDPTGSPINKRISVFNLFGNINHSSNTGDATGRTLVRTTLTVENDATTGDTVALHANVNHTKATSSGDRTIKNLYGAKFQADISGQDAVLTGIVAGAVVSVDVSNGADSTNLNTYRTAGTARAYGIKVIMDDSNADRGVSPDAFLCLDDNGGATSATEPDGFPVRYLFELGSATAGFVAAADRANTVVKAHQTSNNNVMVSTGTGGPAALTDINTSIRVKINGTDYWLAATSALPAA
jgi:hypothetical protein